MRQNRMRLNLSPYTIGRLFVCLSLVILFELMDREDGFRENLIEAFAAILLFLVFDYIGRGMIEGRHFLLRAAMTVFVLYAVINGVK